jgi:hypothetical protein
LTAALTPPEPKRAGFSDIVDGTQVARYPPRGVETAADSNLRLAWQIRELAFESISRSQARLLILGRVTARGTPFVRLNANAVVLPMSRYDIVLRGFGIGHGEFLTEFIQHLSKRRTKKSPA